MDMNTATAKAIQAARAVSGMTVSELSKTSSIPEATLYRILGAERDIKVNQLISLANAMNITIVDLMQDATRIQERSER